MMKATTGRKKEGYPGKAMQGNEVFTAFFTIIFVDRKMVLSFSFWIT